MRHFDYVLCGWFFVYLAICPAYPLVDKVANGEDATPSALDQRVTAFLADKPFVALVVGMIQSDQRRIGGFGKFTDEDDARPPVGQTVFKIGYITKIFTGTLLGETVERGEVKLDGPVGHHLPPEFVMPPTFKDDTRTITLLDLATHRSSLPIQPPSLPMFSFAIGTLANPYSKFGHKKLALTINQIQLNGPVGSKYNYSNLGVGLLGEALVRTTGLENYGLLLTDRIIEVLHMRDTHIAINDDMHPRPAPGHNKKRDDIVG